MDCPVKLRSGIPTDADMRKVNAVSSHPLTADQVFIFGMRVCSNDVDKDFERFTTKSLHSLAKMYIGKPGIIKNEESARIYDTVVVSDIERTTRSGDIYCELIAYAYILRSEVSKQLIEDLNADMVKNVSIGCSVASTTCSICDEETCSHVKGSVYDGKLCFKNLNSPVDAYEWAFVVEPKKPDAAMALDEAIQHCYKVAERLRKSNPCDTCAAEHEQLAHWLEELKKLRVECDGLRSNWYKCAEKVKTLRAERDAAVSDLRKLVPAWKWDGEKEQSSREEAPKCGCVDFG